MQSNHSAEHIDNNIISSCSPSLGRKITPSKLKSTEELLAAFSPRPEVKKSPGSSLPLDCAIVMASPRRLRKKPDISYNDSESSAPPTPSNDSPFSPSQPQAKRHTTFLDLTEEDFDEEEDADEGDSAQPPPPRVSAAGHSLRQHSDLKLSLSARENADKPARTKKRGRGRPPKNPRSHRRATVVSSDVPKTERIRVRETIAAETSKRRSSFFVQNKDVFLPLLPPNNHVSKLAKQIAGNGDEPQMPVVEYEELLEQPKGITAVMKPYQLKGLSFLVWLQRNGLSGILGDEMGLGKTLQTLALLQYLKETRGPMDAGAQPRPSIVICPLSVLDSWMVESRKWVPTMKVLRFHGPSAERIRLKKIALGEEDFFGNVTKLSKEKKNARLKSRGAQVIDLSSDAVEYSHFGADLIVTTYETFTSEQSWFKRAFVWKYVILDEGHKIKNNLSLISSALQGLGAEYRLILTGTPLQNNLTELWALLHWLYPEVFTATTSELFKQSFDLSHGKVDRSVMDNARRLLELIMLRRMKSSPEVNLNLPNKTDVMLFVPLSPLQRMWYQRFLTRVDEGLLNEIFSNAREKEAAEIEAESKLKTLDSKSFDEILKLEEEGSMGPEWEETKQIMKQALVQDQQGTQKKNSWLKLMNLLMQLRKCCGHPYILPGAAPDPYYLGDHVIHASGKFMILEKIINQLVIKEKKKVLIFSGFTRMLDCTEDLLNIRGGDGSEFRYHRLDGSTCRARRNLGIRMFNDASSDYRVMLISTRAGGLGINLTAASDVVMLDQDWNPQVMLQAEARAHRIGQTKPVTVYKMCTQGTVEEQMIGRIQKKLYLSAKVTESMRDIHSAGAKKGKIDNSTADADAPHLNTGQLMSLVRRGAQAISRPVIDVKEVAGWDWLTTLEKCKDKPADALNSEQNNNSAAKDDAEKKWLEEVEQVETRLFDGKKFMKEKARNKTDYTINESREDRRKDKNTTVMVGGYAISKQSMDCGEWEAVPTMAGKDPRLAEPIREKKQEIENQSHCQVCWDGGRLTLCSTCPRSYHEGCLDREFRAQAKNKMQFHCPQHQCADCLQKTTDAGGMLYRCRWCERAFCEDCTEWEKTTLLGDTLKEYTILGFGAVTQAYYVCCHACSEHHGLYPEEEAFCDNMAREYDIQYAKFMAEEEKGKRSVQKMSNEPRPPSRAESLTDATTLTSSGISTPGFESYEVASIARHKRKEPPSTLQELPTKRLILFR